MAFQWVIGIATPTSVPSPEMTNIEDAHSSDEEFPLPFYSSEPSLLSDHSNATSNTTKRLAHIRSVAHKDLQKFQKSPPGEGMAIVYVFVNINDGKAYVGKHDGSNNGKSFWKTRRQKHYCPPPSIKPTYFVNAMRKHGPDAFEDYILWHGVASDVNEQECFWIGPNGLHTIKEDGGWGYNTRKGGEGGKHAPSTCAKMRDAWSKYTPSERSARILKGMTTESLKRRVETFKKTSKLPEVKAQRSASSIESQKRRKMNGEKTLPEIAQEWYLKATKNERDERTAKIKQSINKPHVRDSLRKQAILRESKRPQSKNHESNKLKANKVRSDLELLRRIPGNELASRKDLSKARSSGLIPSGPRAEILAQSLELRRQKTVSLRNQELDKLTGKDRIAKQKKFEKADRAEKIRRLKAIALMSIAKYEDKGLTWCYRNQALAKKDGIVFFQDSEGMWRARMSGQGNGAGSSADHAALTD